MKIENVKLTDATLSPFDIRSALDQEKLDELAASMEGGTGVIEPLIGRRVNGKVEIVAGGRRYRAAKKAKLADIPVIIRELTDDAAMELQLIENIQREDMSPLDEAAGIERLMKLDPARYTAEAVGKRLGGLSAASVYLKLQLLKLTDAGRELVNEGKIDTAHGAALGRLSEGDQKAALAWMKQSATAWGAGGNYPTIKQLREWIKSNVRLDLFSADVAAAQPKIATRLEKLKAEGIEPLQISEHYETKDGVLGRNAYKDIDGKKCDAQETAFLVYGDEIAVKQICRDKAKCKVHFKWEIDQANQSRRAKQRSKPSQQTAEAKQRHKAAEAKQKRAREVYNLTFQAAIVQAVTRAKKVTTEMVRYLVASMDHNSRYVEIFEPAYKAVNLSKAALHISPADIWSGTALKTASEAQLAGLVVIAEAEAAGIDVPGSKYLAGWCKRHGVNFAALQKEAEKQLAAKAEPEQAKLGAKGAKAKKKR